MRQWSVKVYDALSKRKWLAITVAVVLFVLLFMQASQIALENDITKLVPGNPALKEVHQLQSSSGLYDRVIFKLTYRKESGSERLMQAADSLEYELNKRLSKDIKELKVKLDESIFWDVQQLVAEHIACFLDSADYGMFDTLLIQEKLHERIHQQSALLNTVVGMGAKRFFSVDLLGVSARPLSRMQSLQIDERVELHEGYLFTDDRKSVLIFLTLHEDALVKRAEDIASHIHAIETKFKNSFPQIDIYVYGAILVAHGNKVQLQRDTRLTLSLTLIGIFILTVSLFRKKRIPLLIVLPALFGFVFSLSVIKWLQGGIAGLSVAAGSVVLGIAINYSVHFFTQLSFSKNIRQALAELWMPLTLGSFTTVASFLALTLLSSPILHDFGLFAGLSLCGAVFFTLFFLPHFSPPSVNTHTFIDKFSHYAVSSVAPKYISIAFIVVLCATGWLLTQVAQVKFVTELNEMNYMDERLKTSEREILWLQNDTSKTVFVASVAENVQDALQQNETLRRFLRQKLQEGEVIKFASLSEALPGKQLQRQRIDYWNRYWTDEKKQALLQSLQKSIEQVGLSDMVFTDFQNRFFKHYDTLDAQTEFKLLSVFGNGWLVSNGKKTIVFNAITVDKNKKATVYAAIQKLPGILLLDKQIISNAVVDVLYKDFNSILAYTIFIVGAALIIGYGRIELAIITFLPMLLSWVWILGIMGFAGIHFNLINIVISTFIFGLGDDFSIFITDGLVAKFKDGKQHVFKHRLGIFLCAVTTLLGLGMLHFGKHPALKSIAIVSIIGILCVFLIGQLVQPALFNFFIQSRKEKQLAPWTLKTLALSVVAFSYFTLGAFLLTIIGFLLIYAFPFVPKHKRKYWYHFILCYFVKSLVYLMVNVKKVHIDKHNMDFTRPALIVANHTSFLDILVVVMQHPKLILLTNKWVYHSPVFGKVVQMADYYPVMEGVNPAIDKFQKIVKEGYSIVVFPEGTRSPDGKLRRFHKGAFYLAEKLHLDIVPLVLHGIHHTMKKGDFMLFDGTLTMKFLPRIAPENKSYGDGYAERAKGISKLFKEELRKLQHQLETPEFFAQKFLSNYWYTGWKIEREARAFIRRATLIEQVNRHLPKQGNIAVLGAGYGFWPYMLHLLESTRFIIGVEQDDEKRAVAENGYLRNSNMLFTQSIDTVKTPFDVVLVVESEIYSWIPSLWCADLWVIKKPAAVLPSLPGYNAQHLGIYHGFEFIKYSLNER
jgi:1-acyl-sn-glycerol-3-phosphate acyltransferase